VWKERHTLLQLSFDIFSPYKATPSVDEVGFEIYNYGKAVIFIAGISRTLDYQAHTTSYGKSEAYTIHFQV
jgi:hypothetical protein